MTRYWIGNSGDWDDTAHWAASSGGVGGASVPTSSDDVTFDANSFSADGFIVNIPSLSFPYSQGDNVDFSSVTHNFTLQFQDSSAALLIIYGNLTLSNRITITRTGLTAFPSIHLETSSTVSFLSNGASIPGIFFNVFGTGIVNQQDDAIIENLLIGSGLDSPVYNTNGNSLTSSFCSVDSGTFHASSSVLNISAELNTTNASPTAVFDAGTSVILFTGPGFLSFDDPAQILNNVSLLSGSCEIVANANLQFHNLTLAPNTQVTFLQSVIFNITGTFISNGSPGFPITLRSTSPGNTYEIDASITSISQTDVQDCIAGGTIPFVDTDGIDSGNNTNWAFPITPPIPQPPWITSPLFFARAPLSDTPYKVEVRDQYGHLVTVLDRPMKKEFYLYRNKAGSCQFFLDAYDPQAIPNIIQEGVYDIVIRRKGTPVFAGQITYAGPKIDETDKAEVQINATGYLNLFSKREVTVDLPFYDPLQNKLIFGATDGGGIIAIMLDYAQFPINQDGFVRMYGDLPTLNQSFFCPNFGNLVRMRLLLQKIGGAHGNVVVGLYHDQNTAPGSLVPNSVKNIPISSLSTDQFMWAEVTYSGTLPALNSGTKYWIKAYLDTGQSGSDGVAWAYLNNNYYTDGFAYSPEDHGLFAPDQDLQFFVKLDDNTFQKTENTYWGLDQGGLQTSFPIQPSFAQFKKISDVITEITQHNNGVDFNTIVQIGDDNIMRKYFNVFYPGQGIDNTALNFTFPGNVISIDGKKDAEQVNNKIYTRGQGSGPFQTLATSINIGSIHQYGRREVNDDFSDIEDIPTLQAIGDGNAKLKGVPLEVPTIILDGNRAPFVTSYGIGDTILVQSFGPGFLNFQQQYRIDEIHVTIDDDGREKVALSVVF